MTGSLGELAASIGISLALAAWSRRHNTSGGAHRAAPDQQRVDVIRFEKPPVPNVADQVPTGAGESLETGGNVGSSGETESGDGSGARRRARRLDE